MPEPGRLRGRITKRDTAILIAIMVVGVPLVTIALLSVDSAAIRIAVFSAYIALVAVVAHVSRLRFERINRE